MAALKQMKSDHGECCAQLERIVEEKKLQGTTSFKAAKAISKDQELMVNQEAILKTKLAICEA